MRGPEKVLTEEFKSRFDRTGRGLGLGPLTIAEIDDRKASGMAGQAALLRKAIPKAALVCALDERGEVLSSPGFAATLAGWRDKGRSDVVFLIGGADGLAPELRDEADFRLSFGAMVWPHMLARTMLSEQLYRAVSILANLPYHRGA